MSPPKAKSKLPASRSGKIYECEPVPPSVFEALETEAWFRRIQDEHGRRGGRKRTRSAGSRAKDVVFEEALQWFLAHFEKHPPEHFERVTPAWREAAFWVTKDVLNRCRAVAQRAGVTKRRLIATALMLYCERLVPEELVQFRQKTFGDARKLYQQHRSAIRAALRSKKAH